MPGYEPQAFMGNRLERVLLCDVHCFSPLFVCGFVDDCHATLRRLRTYDSGTVFSFAKVCTGVRCVISIIIIVILLIFVVVIIMSTYVGDVTIVAAI